LIQAPRSFNLDVILPNKISGANSPMRDSTLNSESCDAFKDLESTEDSQLRRDEDMEDQSENKNFSGKSKVFNINGILIDNFLASDDLNECVDFLLKKQKFDGSKTFNKIIRHNASGKSKEKKRRYRKNLDQHSILLEYYEKNPNWDK
jgi:hypothetical protein